MTRYALIAALLVAVAGGLYGKGRVDGKAALEARIERAEAAARESRAKMEAQRLAIEAERERFATQLEDEARADPVLVPQCLSPDRVRRLDRLQ